MSEVRSPSIREARGWLIYVGIPLLTFILGILAQQLLQDYLSHHDILKLGMFFLAISVCAVGIVLGFTARSHSNELAALRRAAANEARHVAAALRRMDLSSGLLVDYVADVGVGASYSRAAAVIRNARESLTFVDLWEPFENYQRDPDDPASDETKPAREDFYAAVLEMTELHRQDSQTFHRRVVQVPSDVLGDRIPFYVDPPFRDYLRKVAATQNSHPLSCKLRISSPLIKMHFIIIDRRYIIMPVLSQDEHTQRQLRYGALFFDDSAGNLYSCLRQMYQVIESRSRPIEESDLTAEPEPTTVEAAG